MNREIKFRVWSGNRMEDDTEAKRILYNLATGSTLQPSHFPIMQYTGLKDKNGKEIYDGDIVVFYKGYVDDTWTDTEQGKPYVIENQNQEGYVGFKAVRKNMSLVPLSGTYRGRYKWQWEVIGNIYETPELLQP